MIYLYFCVAVLLIPIGIYFYSFFKRILKVLGINTDSKTVKYGLTAIITILVVLCSNPYGVYIVIFGHFFFFCLVMELIKWILHKLKKDGSLFNKVFNSGFIPIVLTIFILTYAYANMLNVVEKDYSIYTDKKLNHDYRVLFISDLHFGTTMDNEKLLEYQKKFSNLNLSFVLLGGDIVDENTSKKEMREVFETLGSIQSEFGTFFIYGNHDKTRYSNNRYFSVEDLEDSIESSNIKILDDESFDINDDLTIIGRSDLTFPSSDVRKTSSQLMDDLDKNRFLLIVDHHPTDLAINAQNGFDLQLSGHTHGGQMFPTGLITEWFNGNNLNYGYKKIGSFMAIVSSGMGGWSYPFRTGNNSEYLLVRIASRKN